MQHCHKESTVMHVPFLFPIRRSVHNFQLHRRVYESLHENKNKWIATPCRGDGHQRCSRKNESLDSTFRLPSPCCFHSTLKVRDLGQGRTSIHFSFLCMIFPPFKVPVITKVDSSSHHHHGTPLFPSESPLRLSHAAPKVV